MESVFHASLVFSDLWGAIFAGSLENTLSWALALAISREKSRRIVTRLWPPFLPWWSVQQCQSEKFSTYLTISQKKFAQDKIMLVFFCIDTVLLKYKLEVSEIVFSLQHMYLMYQVLLFALAVKYLGHDFFVIISTHFSVHN